MKQDVVLLLLLPLRPSLPFSKVTSISTLHLLSLKVFTGLHSIDLLVFMVDTLSLVLFSLQFLFIVELVTTTPLLHTSVLNALLGTGTSLTLCGSSSSSPSIFGDRIGVLRSTATKNGERKFEGAALAAPFSFLKGFVL